VDNLIPKQHPETIMYWELLFRMKKIYLTCLFAILTIWVLSLFSCSKSEDKNETSIPTASIVGKWKLKSSVKNGVPKILSACDLYGQSEFKENKTIFVLYGSFTNNNCVPKTANATYDLVGDILIVYGGSASDPNETKSKVISISQTTLVCKDYSNKHLSGNPLTFVETIIPESEQTTYTLERIN
jgi:hypothetical protein